VTFIAITLPTANEASLSSTSFAVKRFSQRYLVSWVNDETRHACWASVVRNFVRSFGEAVMGLPKSTSGRPRSEGLGTPPHTMSLFSVWPPQTAL